MQCIGATGATRVDLLVTEGENEYVLEVNTLPGLTPTSLLPKVAQGAGLDFDALVEAILLRATLGAQGIVPARRRSADALEPARP